MKKLDIWHKKLNQDKELSKDILSLDEINKAKSFYKKEDEKNYIISHTFLREILSHYHPSIHPREWTFQFSKYNKPSVASSHKINFHFNISHSKSHIYVAYSKNLECGIDVEDIRDMNLDKSLLNLVMSKDEQKEFINAKDKETLFFKYWTLKEAHLKTSGDGVSLGMSNISFTNLEEKDNYFKVKDRHYWSFNFEDKYYLSFSAQDKQNTIEVNYYKEEDL